MFEHVFLFNIIYQALLLGPYIMPNSKYLDIKGWFLFEASHDVQIMPSGSVQVQPFLRPRLAVAKLQFDF